MLTFFIKILVIISLFKKIKKKFFCCNCNMRENFSNHNKWLRSSSSMFASKHNIYFSIKNLIFFFSIECAACLHVSVMYVCLLVRHFIKFYNENPLPLSP
jgi:hypothetical protein